jgi:hypothetical protein
MNKTSSFTIFPAATVGAIRKSATDGTRPDPWLTCPIGLVGVPKATDYKPARGVRRARCRACGELLSAGARVVEFKAWSSTVVRLHLWPCGDGVAHAPKKVLEKRPAVPVGRWSRQGGVFWLLDDFYVEQVAWSRKPYAGVPRWRGVDASNDTIIGSHSGYATEDEARVGVEDAVLARANGLLWLLNEEPVAKGRKPNG